MKKLLYTGLAALMIMLFSVSASAATMDVNINSNDFEKVYFEYTSPVDSTITMSSGHAGEFSITLNIDWDTVAYCVDLDNEMETGSYDISLEPVNKNSGNYLYAAWLMDSSSAVGSGNTKKTAGLQLAIWDAIYDNEAFEVTEPTTSNGIGDFYSDYNKPALSNDVMWSDLGYKYALTTYGEGIDAQKLLVQLDPVPEPATMLLLGMGIAGLGAAGRKRFRKQ